MTETLTPMLSKTTVQKLRNATRNEVLTPTDKGYVETCTV